MWKFFLNKTTFLKVSFSNICAKLKTLNFQTSSCKLVVSFEFYYDVTGFACVCVCLSLFANLLRA